MWLILLTSVSFASDNLIKEAATSYTVPSFSSKQLVVEGQDLLSMSGDVDGLGAINGQVALIYNQASQTAQETTSFGNATTIYATNAGTHQLSLAAEEVAAFSRLRYGDDPRGMYLATRGAGGFGKVADIQPLGDVVGGVGVGYGRVIDVRTLVQAQAMFDVLDRSPSARQLQEVAEVIGRRGEYAQKYKFDADIYFYKDIAKALGGADTAQVYKIQQVLDSPLYNIGSRYTGWQAGADFDAAMGDFFNGDAFGVTTRIGVGGTYAMMLGSSSVLLPVSVACIVSEGATQVLTSPLSGGKCSEGFTIALGTGLGIDHSSSWNTSFAAGVSQTYAVAPSLAMSSVESFVEVSSNAAVGSDLVWTNAFKSASTTSVGGPPTLGWDFTSTITYYIF